jgi:hypothetical protein
MKLEDKNVSQTLPNIYHTAEDYISEGSTQIVLHRLLGFAVSKGVQCRRIGAVITREFGRIWM